jgi:hypothetical protein
MALVVEHLPSKHKELNLNPGTTTQKLNKTFYFYFKHLRLIMRCFLIPGGRLEAENGR